MKEEAAKTLGRKRSNKRSNLEISERFYALFNMKHKSTQSEGSSDKLTVYREKEL